MQPDELTNRLTYILQRVQKAAMRDGIITNDEKILIDITEKGISQILDYIKEKETLLADKDQKKVARILEKLEDETVSMAELDDFISDDEIAILGVLFSGIDKLFI
ncbi:MAG: hypothetical protein D6732_24865 [Methanobacteriota archaeon]|nr:MAG: hypothetical protein D6732_24865 [Euryarchaeota archaeon]